MSDLLGNDFTETYIRLENNLTSNFEQFVVDRENKLIMTTPFFRESRLTSNFDISAISNKVTPENTNIIIDAITLISTNPNVANFLPLKVTFDNKPLIEFADPDITTLTDYKIIIEPPINNNTVHNRRYSSPTNSTFKIPAAAVLIDIVEHTTSDGVTRFYFRTDTTRLSEYNQNTQVLTVIATPPSPEPLVLFANNFIAVGINNATTGELIDLRNGLIIATIGFPIVHINLFGDLLIVTYDTGVGVNVNFYSKPVIGNIWLLIRTIVLINAIIPDACVNIETNEYYLYSAINGNIYYRNIEDDINHARIVFNFPAPVGDDSFELFYGGSDLTFPILSLFSSDTIGGTFRWHFINLKTRTVNTTSFDFLPQIFFKRYQNYVYMPHQESLYLLNLDTNEILIYPLLDNKIIVPVLLGEENAVNISDFNLTFASVVLPDNLFIKLLGNQRPVDQVYKLAFDYAERTFPFTLSNKTIAFEIALVNGNPISDLEIFKYVIDFRIRYTNQNIQVNRSVRLKSSPLEIVEKKEKKKKVKLGDAEDVLGLVDDEDFSIQDFLKLYV